MLARCVLRALLVQQWLALAGRQALALHAGRHEAGAPASRRARPSLQASTSTCVIERRGAGVPKSWVSGALWGYDCEAGSRVLKCAAGMGPAHEDGSIRTRNERMLFAGAWNGTAEDPRTAPSGAIVACTLGLAGGLRPPAASTCTALMGPKAKPGFAEAPPSTGAGPREVTLWCNAISIYLKRCSRAAAH